MQIEHWFVGALAIAVVCGCDRKSENAAVESEEDAAIPPMVVEETTVAAVQTVPSDAGADATPAVAGFAVTSIAVRGNSAVVETLVSARCQREERCEHVGDKRKYATIDNCREKIAGDWKDDLNRFDCPGGYDQKELDECLQKIRSEECKNPFDTLARIIACRASDICIAK